jgi:hypothetical protein
VVDSINPAIPLRTMIANWNAITEELEESPRKRRTQEYRHRLDSKTS